MELFPEDECEVERASEFVVSRWLVETFPVKTANLELPSEIGSEAGVEMLTGAAKLVGRTVESSSEICKLSDGGVKSRYLGGAFLEILE